VTSWTVAGSRRSCLFQPPTGRLCSTRCSPVEKESIKEEAHKKIFSCGFRVWRQFAVAQ
jgi:hypothetical protein